MSGYRLLRAIVVGVVTVAGVWGGLSGAVLAQSADLTGCGKIFSVASIGIEGRVQGTVASGISVIISVLIVNVTDDEVLVPVGEESGVWEVADDAGERTDYDADRSIRLTSAGMGGDLGMAPDGERTLKLVFNGVAEPATLFNDDLGGDLGRDGVAVCGGSGADSGSDDRVDGEPTATARLGQPAQDKPTAEPTEPAEPTATRRPNTPTATPERATATPRRATATPRAATPTPASRGSSGERLASSLETSTFQLGEYFGEVPFVDAIDCPEDADAYCVGAVNDVGVVAFVVFDSSGECASYADANDLRSSIFSDEYLGYDYSFVPSYLSDDGSSVAVAVVGQTLVVALAEDPGSGSGLYSDPDVNALGLLFGGIQRADRLR